MTCEQTFDLGSVKRGNQMHQRTVWVSARVVALTLVLCFAPRVEAQCRETACDFQSTRTIIREDLWRGSTCDLLTVEGLDRRYYDTASPVRAPIHFVRGVCLVERLSRGMSGYASEGQRLGPWESAIAELQQAQSTALLPSQRHVAALFEGIAHCKAMDELARKGTQEGSDRRCAHRSMAKASFSRLDMAGLDLTYAEPQNAARFDAVIEDMLACQESHLHAREAAACGIRHAPTEGELAGVVAQASDQVLPRYFGSDGVNAKGEKAVSPVVAMIGRKIQEAQAASEGSREAFSALQKKRDQLLANYQRLAGRLCGGRVSSGAKGGDEQPCSFPGIGRMYDAYDAAIQEVAKYIAFVEQSAEGLLRDESTPDVSKSVRDSARAASETVALLAPKREALRGLKDDLTRLSVDPLGGETIRRACRLLVCDIYEDFDIREDRACRSVDPDSPTRQTLRAVNPLCGPNKVKESLVPGVTVESLCRSVGFEPVAASCN